MTVFVPVDRCGAVPDFHQVPFFSTGQTMRRCARNAKDRIRARRRRQLL